MGIAKTTLENHNFNTSKILNKINKKTRANAKTRLKTCIFLVTYALLFLLFAILADPRSPKRSGIIQGRGFASYLPLWGNATFGILLIFLVIVFTFEIARELNNCFIKINMTSINILIWILLLLPQCVPAVMLIVCVYFKVLVDFMRWNTAIIIYLVCLSLTGLLVFPYRAIIKDSKNNTKFNRRVFPLVGIFISVTLVGFFYLTIVRGWTTILFFMLIPVFTDSGAYFVGILFGKHKLAPVLSPKKTWEGLIGGVIITYAISSLILWAYGFGGEYFLQESVFGAQWTYNKNAIPGESVSWWVIAFVLITVAIGCSVLGDLSFSLFKRKNKIKDYSDFLAGHGGLLDRFDSWFIEIGVLHFILIIISVCSTFINKDDVNRIFNVVPNL